MGREDNSTKYLMWNSLMNFIVLSACFLPLSLYRIYGVPWKKSSHIKKKYCYDEKVKQILD